MTAHRIVYTGPSSLAVQAATLLADADGVELTASERPQVTDAATDTVVLAVTVEGTPDAVAEAVALLEDQLPDGATVEVVDPPTS